MAASSLVQWHFQVVDLQLLNTESLVLRIAFHCHDPFFPLLTWQFKDLLFFFLLINKLQLILALRAPGREKYQLIIRK